MGLKKVVFMSRKEAESYSRWGWSIISITGLDPARLSGGWYSVLRLEFDDIDVDAHGFVPEDPYILFNLDHAYQIIQFVAECDQAGVDTLVVHCQGGISRSAAVAKWIAKAYGLEFPADYNQENKYVYETLCRGA